MKTYYYQLLRYVHDQFTGEFVNLGVIVYSPEDSFLKAKMTKRYARVNSLFPEANGKFIIASAKYLEEQLNFKIAPRLKELFNPSQNLDLITSEILPIDDSALQLTEVKKAIDIDLEIALSDLFGSLVEKYLPSDKSPHRLSDEDVWRKKYKDYFDKFQVSDRLIPHQVQTKNDVFQFGKAWKNEVWHCYEPVSFDQKRKETVRDKVYRLVGMINELAKTSEEIHLILLSSVPAQHRSLVEFVKSSLNLDFKGVKVDVVFESEAEKLARDVARQMEIHDSHNN